MASFWLELLCDVVGMNDVRANERFEQLTVTHVFVPDASTVSETSPWGRYRQGRPPPGGGGKVTTFEHAKWPADALPSSHAIEVGLLPR